MCACKAQRGPHPAMNLCVRKPRSVVQSGVVGMTTEETKMSEETKVSTPDGNELSICHFLRLFPKRPKQIHRITRQRAKKKEQWTPDHILRSRESNVGDRSALNNRERKTGGACERKMTARREPTPEGNTSTNPHD